MRNGYRFLDHRGTFELEEAENVSYLYFPIAGENGIKSALTPNLGGDSKLGQNQFLLQPVSAEDLHNNKASRNFWCCMEGEIWSATGMSAEAESCRFTKNQEKSCVTAGPMWQKTRRIGKKNEIEAEITSFVPCGFEETEIMYVTLTNHGKQSVTLTPVAAVPIYGRSADNIRDHRHVTSLLHRIYVTESGIFVTPTLSFDERGHQRNQSTYYVCGTEGNGTKPVGFYPITEEFIGEGGSFTRPGALFEKKEPVKAGTRIDGYEAMGGIVFKETVIEPGETKDYIVYMGIEEKERQSSEAEHMLTDLGTTEKIKAAFEDTTAYWEEKINVSYHTGDSEFDNFMHWVSFQPMLRRIYGCSFLPHHDYGKGGRGWRDLWQDCLALLIMNPDGVREMLIDNFAGVRFDGTNATIIGNRQGEFIADRNSITRVWMDHGVWPLITTVFYINQTGDLDILLKTTTYFKDKQVWRGTKTDLKWKEEDLSLQKDCEGQKYEGTILEHLLLQNLTAFYEVGEHNHIRLRGADWNDAMDMAPERGESVAFTAAYAENLLTLAELMELLAKERNVKSLEIAKEMEVLFTYAEELYNSAMRKKELLDQYLASCEHVVSGEKTYLPMMLAADSLRKKGNWIKEHIRREEWLTEKDGGWFNGYYDNHGYALEKTGEDPRMLLTSQVFTIMSGTATEEQTAQIIKSADRYLYKEKCGGYCLNTDFRELKTDMGRMFGFAYGHKENGAVFSHMTTMFANALYKRGFAKEGFKALNTLYRQALNFSVSRIYPGIPEYFNDKGRGMYHYLTGAASWYMLTVITEMFGVKGRLGNLVLEPKLMKEQFDKENRAEISLRFGDKNWRIAYVNEEKKDYGEYKISELWADGKKIAFQEKTGISLEKIKELEKNEFHEIVAVLR